MPKGNARPGAKGGPTSRKADRNLRAVAQGRDPYSTETKDRRKRTVGSNRTLSKNNRNSARQALGMKKK